MSEFQNSVMVALRPTTSGWCMIDLPHMTIVYVGEIPDIQKTTHNKLLKVALDVSTTLPAIRLDVIGTTILGQTDLVDVLLLRKTEELMQFYYAFEEWDSTEFLFKPHVTIGPMGSRLDVSPSALMFDEVFVSWGEETTSYKLGA